MGLDALFSPRAVAVIGASNRELTIGYRIVENLLRRFWTSLRGWMSPISSSRANMCRPASRTAPERA
jgi:hypothetical protein